MSLTATLRVRISTQNAHYGNGLAAGALCLELFGDVATELAIRSDGDEGLLRAYESVEFLDPVYAGDFLEVEGTLVAKGNTSRRCTLEAWKVIDGRDPSRPRVLDDRVLVARATGTTIAGTGGNSGPQAKHA